MSAALKRPNLLIAPVGNHGCSAWIATKEVLAHVCATFCFKCLVITISSAIHQINECTFGVLSKKFIPFATPDNLDDIPTGAAKD